MDDAQGRREAQAHNIPQTGTLGVLAAASQNNLIDLKTALHRLRLTSFFVSERLLQLVLERAKGLNE